MKRVLLMIIVLLLIFLSILIGISFRFHGPEWISFSTIIAILILFQIINFMLPFKFLVRILLSPIFFLIALIVAYVFLMAN